VPPSDRPSSARGARTDTLDKRGLLFKALATIFAVFVLILIAGLSGLSVRVWPTGFRLQ